MIAAIYEAVIRPGRFGAFLEIWRDHISEVLAAPVDLDKTGPEIEIDPELAAHFKRAHEILDRLGRSQPEAGLADRVARSGGFVMVADGRGACHLGRGARLARRWGIGPDCSAGSHTVGAIEVGLGGFGGGVAGRRVRDRRAGSDPRGRPRHLIARAEPGEEPLLVIEALDYHWGAAGRTDADRQFWPVASRGRRGAGGSWRGFPCVKSRVRPAGRSIPCAIRPSRFWPRPARRVRRI
ncbi:hypothetical protein ACFOHS_09155 [Jhaorihella thermophila]